MKEVLGITLHNDGYVIRTLVTTCKEQSDTEELLEFALGELERSFDIFAVKESK